MDTLKEVGRCTREGGTINTFMLERSRPLTEFVDRMTRLNRWRAFHADPEQLGEFILVDYVARRSARVAYPEVGRHVTENEESSRSPIGDPAPDMGRRLLSDPHALNQPNALVSPLDHVHPVCRARDRVPDRWSGTAMRPAAG